MTSAQDVRDMCMLQIFCKHKCMLVSKALEKFAVIYQSDSVDEYHDALQRIGKVLDDLKMQIKTFKFFNDKQKYIAIINKAEGSAAAMSSKYTPAQKTYFYNVVEHIATEGQDDEDPEAAPGVCSLGVNTALNLSVASSTQATQMTQEQAAATQSLRMSIAEKEKTIESLVEDMWLASDDDGRVYIGPRTFLELTHHLLTLDLPEATLEAWKAGL